MPPGCLIQLDEQIYTMEVDTLHHRFFVGEGEFFHLHPSYHFILVSKGSCQMLLKDCPPIPVRENSFIFINPLVPHAFTGDPGGVEHSALIWKFRGPDGNPALFPLQKLVCSGRQDYQGFYIRELNDFDAKNFLQKHRSAERAYRHVSFFAASMKAFELFFLGLNLILGDEIEAVEAVDNAKRITLQVESIVEQEMIRADFRVRDIARSIGLNASYLNAVFKADTGMPISVYITQKRIELAKILMENTSYNVSEIAGMCGFNQLSYFSRTFKKICGISPHYYRNRNF